MVLDYQYAERRFGDISRAVGQSVRVDDVLLTVIGVAPREFSGVDPSSRSDFYIPLHADLLIDSLSVTGLDPNRRFTEDTFYWIQLWARLQPGVTLDQAQAVLAPVFRRFVEASATSDRERADLPALLLREGAGGLDRLRRQYSKPLYFLMTMVGLILAIACANVANLLLARATGRQHEIALRLSLGADRGRLTRQLLTESLLLSSLGGALGLIFAACGIRALTALIGNGRENFTLHASLNWHVLAIGLSLSLVTGILFGLAPTLRATRVDLNHVLRQTRTGVPPMRLFARLRITPNEALVVSQIAVSLLLLMTAGLFVRTLANLNAVSLGFNSERLLLVTLNAGQAGYKDSAIIRFYEEVRGRFSVIPGVRGVSTSNLALISGSESSTSVKVAGYSGKNRQVSFLYVGPTFLSNMQIPILLGREIDERDLDRGSAVVVVNQEFARTYFNNEHPIGRHFSMRMMGALPDLEIVGVSRDARYNSLKHDIAPTVYLPYSTNLITLRGGMVFEVRAAGDPNAIAQAVRTAVRQRDANVPISDITTQAKRIDQSMSQERTLAALCTCFALLAVLIACVGLYGTLAYTVARRTSEIGIRVALGAQRGSVMLMILGEALLMAAVGLAIGIPAILAASRVLETFLFEIKPTDPVALTTAVGILCGAVLVAGCGPALRASRVDPWTALREE
jgi:predicted permease